MSSSEAESLRSQILELEHEITEIKVEYEEKIASMDMLFAEEKDILEMKIQDLKARLDIIDAERKSVNFENDKMDEILEMMNKKENEMKGIEERYKTEIEYKNKKIRNLEYRNNSLEQKLSELEKKLNLERKKMNEELVEEKKKVENLEKRTEPELPTKSPKQNIWKFFGGGSKKKKKVAIPEPLKKKPNKGPKPSGGLAYLFRSMEEDKVPAVPAETRRVEAWSEGDCLEWLREIGLQHELGGVFRVKKVAGNVLLDAIEFPLEELTHADRMCFKVNVLFLKKTKKMKKEFSRKVTLLINNFSTFLDIPENAESVDIKNVEQFVACASSEDRLLQRLEETKKKYFEVLEETKGPKFPCFLVMIPSDRFRSETFHQIVHPRFRTLTQTSSERYHFALRIGPWIFEWNPLQNIYPQCLDSLQGDNVEDTTSGGLLSIPIEEEVAFGNISLLEKKLVDVIMKFNRYRTFHLKKCNSVHFIEEVFSSLSGKKGPKFQEKSISQIFRQVRKNGETPQLPLELINIKNWGFGEIVQWTKVIGLEDSLKKKELPFGDGQALLNYNLEDERSEYVLEDLFPLPSVPRDDNSGLTGGKESPFLLLRDKVLLRRKLFQVNIFHLQQTFNVYGRKTFDRSFPSVCFKIFQHERSIPMKYDAVEFFVHCLSDQEHLEKHYLQKKLDQSAYLSKVGKKSEETEGEKDDEEDGIFDDEDVEDLDAKDLFDLITMGGYKKQPVLRVKIIITEIAFSKSEKLLRSLLSPVMTNLPVSVNSDFGLFHTALLLGPFYLEWTKREVIIPKRISSSNALLSFDVDPVELISLDRYNEVIQKIAKVVIKWNTRYKYTKSKGKNQGNCQDFIDELSHELGIDLKFQKESVFGGFIEEMRTKGNAEIFFQPRKDFVEKFDLEKFKYFDKYKTSEGKFKIVFKTHEELDDFVHTLVTNTVSKYQQNFQMAFSSEYKLLKAFDRAFWLRFIKTNKKEYAPSMKRLVYGATRKCGCPFSDPRDTFSYV